MNKNIKVIETFSLGEELSLLDKLVFSIKGSYLSDLQKTVLKYSLENHTYDEIAEREGYSDKYLKRDVGPRLWKTLSIALGEKVGKKNFREALGRKLKEVYQVVNYEDVENSTSIKQNTLYAPGFWGRNQELAQLQQWIFNDYCNLIAIFGMAGIGKTTLIQKLTQQIQDYFETVIWLSPDQDQNVLAKNAFENLFHYLEQSEESASSTHVEDKKQQELLNYLLNHKILIIIDNFDIVLRNTNLSEQQRKETKQLLDLVNYLGNSKGLSRLILLSREKPQISTIENPQNLYYLELQGLNKKDIKHLLDLHKIVGSKDEREQLIQLYDNNPKFLSIALSKISFMFNNDIACFLDKNFLMFNEIEADYDWYHQRLTENEKEIVYWLAIFQDDVSIQMLEKYLFFSENSISTLINTLESLKSLSLVHTNGEQIGLSSLAKKYFTECLIQMFYEDIKHRQYQTLNRYSLITTQLSQHIQESQINSLIKPLIKYLLAFFCKKQLLEHHLKSLVLDIKREASVKEKYAIGNIINIMAQFQGELSDLNLSNLIIQQVNFQNYNLQNTNLTNSTLVDSVFSKNFALIKALKFSPDNQFLITVDHESRVNWWNLENSEEVIDVKCFQNWVQAVALDKTGEMAIIALKNSSCLKMFNIKTGQCQKTFRHETSRVQTVVISPDGRFLASGSSDASLKIWSIETGQCLKHLQGHQSSVECLTFSPDGQFLASGSSDATIRIWSVNTGQCCQQLQGHHSSVDCLTFSPDGQFLASGSRDTTIRIWSVNLGQCFKRLQGHHSSVNCITFSPDGQFLVSGSRDTTIRIWSVNLGQCFKRLQGHHSSVNCITFSPDGQFLASSSDDSCIRVWAFQEGHCHRMLQGNKEWSSSLAFSPDDRILISNGNKLSLRLWDIQTGRMFRHFSEQTNVIKTVNLSPNGDVIVSGSNNGEIRLRFINSLDGLKILQGHISSICSTVFSPTGHLFASSCRSGRIKIWDVAMGECLQSLPIQCGAVPTLAFNSDGQCLASGGSDGSLKLWDVWTGECLKSLSKPGKEIIAVCFSNQSDQHLISVDNNGLLEIWDTCSDRCLRSFRLDLIQIVSFSKDGQWIATDSKCNTIKLWDVNTGQCLQTLQGHTSLVCAVAFSSDNQTLVSSSLDGEIKFWDIKTGKCQKTLENPKLYKHLNVTNIEGLTNNQISNLKALGALQEEFYQGMIV